MDVGVVGYSGFPTEAGLSGSRLDCQQGCREEKSADVADQSDARVSQGITGNHAEEVKGSPLVCDYWNVAGIPAPVPYTHLTVPTDQPR